MRDVVGDVALVAVRGCGNYRLRLRSTKSRHQMGRFEEPRMGAWHVEADVCEQLRIEAAEELRRNLQRGRGR